MTYRVAKLQPWYHQPKPRCSAHILVNDMQCMFSATHQGTGNKKEVYLCHIHARMAEFMTQPIKAENVWIRDGQ